MHDSRERLRGDPLPWLLYEAMPAVRHLALRDLLDEPSPWVTLRACRVLRAVG